MLVECKECGKQIARNAGTCPHCGNKVMLPAARKLALGCLIVPVAIFFILGLAGYILQRNDSRTSEKRHTSISKKLTQTRPYEVFQEEDFSFPGRTRYTWRITSLASTFEERAHTAMKAALDLQRKTGCQVANVWMEINPKLSGAGYVLSQSTYAPDGRGNSGTDNWTWQVRSSNTTPDPISIKAGELLVFYHRNYQKRGIEVEDSRLREMIAEVIGIEPQDVRMPLVFCKDFDVTDLVR